MADIDEIEKDRFFFAATDNAIKFLTRLSSDSDLRQICEGVNLEERLNIARNSGYEFSESHMRVAIRIWDYHGEWRKWLTSGHILHPETNLPALDDSYVFDDHLIKSYERDGHVLLRNVMSSTEVDSYRSVFRDVIDGPSMRSDREQDLNLFADVGFISLINLRVQDRRAARFVYARRFGEIAAKLMGVDKVRVYLDETFEKYPGFSKTHWHQDRLYFPLDTDKLVTMWMPMVNVAVDMGTLMMASNSHVYGDFGYRPIKDDSNQYYEDVIREKNLSVVQLPSMRAGDASFHNGWLLHGAPANTTNLVREVMSVVFYPDGTRLCEPKNEYQRRAIELGFRKSPGELAESPIHPVVFDRYSSRN